MPIGLGIFWWRHLVSDLLTGPDGPRIRCYSTSAFVGDRDVYLRCEVRARPPPSALYWVLDDDNSTTATRVSHAAAVAGHYGQDYWTVAIVCPLTHSLLSETDSVK